MASPERLVPTHLTPDKPEVKINPNSQKSEQEQRYEARAELIDSGPNLENMLREAAIKRGETPPEGLNLSLIEIENFQRRVRSAEDARRITREAKDPIERARAFILYNRQKALVEEYLADGPPYNEGPGLRKAYREYIRNRNEYVHFKSALAEIRALTDMLNQPSFESLDETAFLSGKDQRRVRAGKKAKNQGVRSYARIEGLMHKEHLDPITETDSQAVLDSLATIYPEGSEEYIKLKAEIEAAGREEHEGKFQTKKDVEDELARLKRQVDELWQNPMVRYFSSMRELEGMMQDYHSGEAVLETQSVIRALNKLHEWETQHQRTTIGGVLVGPPGVGKTTLVHHYLEAKGRPDYAYIDLSEDVTRYLLYGSKSIEFKNPTEFYTSLVANLNRLSNQEDIRRFVIENAKTLSTVFNVKGDEATVLFLSQLQETLENGAKAESLPQDIQLRITTLHTQIKNLTEETFRKELASEFAHVVKRNGWRDGMVIAALRRGESVIFDEFNKNKNWSLIYSLMTAEPGKDWYFADNDEHIRIPEDWRIYFTANIGSRHGGFAVAEALASRAGGKVIEVGYPTPREELLVALTAMSNPEGDFMRSNEDLGKLFILIHDVFPGMRKYLEDKKQSVPISFRTIRDLAEKLLMAKDPKSKKMVYQATTKSFDQALYDVLVEAYALFEDKEPAKEWVSTMTSVGLLLDDERLKPEIVKWISEAEYEERKKTRETNRQNYDQIVSKIKGMTRNMSADMVIPDQPSF